MMERANIAKALQMYSITSSMNLVGPLTSRDGYNQLLASVQSHVHWQENLETFDPTWVGTTTNSVLLW